MGSHFLLVFVAKAQRLEALQAQRTHAGLAARAQQHVPHFLAHLVVGPIVLPNDVAVSAVANPFAVAHHFKQQFAGCGPQKHRLAQPSTRA